VALNLDGKVHVRLISLENCPAGFGRDVTRGANTQNRIQHRDFAALDPTQSRIAVEMEMDGKKYAFKSGDLEPIGDQGCNIEDATIAIACANEDITLAAQAKREVGALWRDIEKAPYTTLFNDNLNARHMWMAVKVLRTVTGELDEIDKKDVPRGELVAVHGNRFILHMVFQDSDVRRYREPSLAEATIIEASRKATRRIFHDLSRVVESQYQSAYLANIFKNAQKYKELEESLEKDTKTHDPQFKLNIELQKPKD
jgi:hypothetical protein